MKNRNINLDLLKAISVFLIILYHGNLRLNYNIDGSIVHTDIPILNQIFLNAVGIWGQVGVVVFVFITAYFMTEKEKIRPSKVCVISMQTAFWGGVTALIGHYLGVIPLDLKNGIKILFSVPLGYFWFITAYCMLYLTIPFLNYTLKVCNKKVLNKLCVLLTVLIPIYKTVYPNANFGTYMWMCYLYILFGTLKQNSENWFEKNYNKGLWVSVILCFCMVSAGSLLARKYNMFITLTNNTMHVGAIFPVIIALFLFYKVKNMQIPNLPGVQFIAESSLSIYIIHENFMYLIDNNCFWWDYFLHVGKFADSIYFPIVFILGCVITMLVCATVDKLWIRIERILSNSKPFKSLDVKCQDIFEITD